MSDRTSSRPLNPASTPSPSPNGRTTERGIRRAGRDDESYNDVLNLDVCYFVNVYVKGTGRARELEARKVAERRRKERMGTVPLSEFSRHRASAADGGRGGEGFLGPCVLD